nr:MAG TPA: hypothetical protein [Caudoviricetes sp.]
MKKKFFANLWLTFHSWSPVLIQYSSLTFHNTYFPFQKFVVVTLLQKKYQPSNIDGW